MFGHVIKLHQRSSCATVTKTGVIKLDQRSSCATVIKTGVIKLDQRSSCATVIKSGVIKLDQRSICATVIKTGVIKLDQRSSRATVINPQYSKDIRAYPGIAKPARSYTTYCSCFRLITGRLLAYTRSLKKKWIPHP